MLASILLLVNMLFGLPSTALNSADSVQKEIYLADPYVLLYNGTYYIYGTGNKNGIEVYQSDDLMKWTGPCGKRSGLALHKDDVWGDKWFWAPEVYHVNNKFYMFFSTEEHIVVAVSDNPLGPFVQQKQEPLLKTKAIDTHLFIDDDGRKYLYYVAFTNGNVIWMCEMEDDLLSIKPNTTKECFGASQLWEKSKKQPVADVNEGPYMVKRDGTYYLFYSGNHFENPDYGMGYAASKSPYGPWVKYANNPILKSSGDNLGTGHGALFTDKLGNLVLVYHVHYDKTTVAPRKIRFNYCKYNKEKGIFELLDTVYKPFIQSDK